MKILVSPRGPAILELQAHDLGRAGVSPSNIGTLALASHPTGLEPDGVGNVYVADFDAHRVVRVAPREPRAGGMGGSEGSQRLPFTTASQACPDYGLTQQDVAGGATTSAISLGPGSDPVTRVTYQTSAGQWDVFMSTTSDNNFCLFRGQVIR